MSNKSNTVGTGTAIILTVLILIFIGWIISLFEPKCAMSGCKNEAKEGSKYCYLHDMSYRYYGNPDYNAVYEKQIYRKFGVIFNSSYLGAWFCCTALRHGIYRPVHIQCGKKFSRCTEFSAAINMGKMLKT